MIELVLMKGEIAAQRFNLQKETTVVGRSRGCDISIDDGSVSSQHARIDINNNTQTGLIDVFLKDLDSTNGTFVNGKKISTVHLNHNDEIAFADVRFKFYTYGLNKYSSSVSASEDLTRL